MTKNGLQSLALLLISFFGMPLHAAPRLEEHGEVAFSPSLAEPSVPERFRMAANHFPWHATRMQTVSATHATAAPAALMFVNSKRPVNPS